MQIRLRQLYFLFQARDANFADIVTLPILPEPQQNPLTAGMNMWRSGEFSAYALKDRILGKY